MIEIWKVVPGFKGKYSISNIGRFRSNYRLNKWNNSRNYKHYLITPGISKLGYKSVSLGTRSGFYKSYSIHRLVALSFIGKPPKGKTDVNHINLKPSDNRLENLEYVTHHRNMNHAYDNGSYDNWRGSKHRQAILNETQVRVIKRLLKNHNITRKEVAETFGVSFHTIEGIRRNRQWRHVK